ncbi:MAG TPA: hypothetical protein VGN16_14810 [Acidobacteriaceae bacterium]|jgi:hypothetical protein
MFSFAPKLPINEQTRVWIDEGFVRLSAMLGRGRMLQAEVVLPEDSFFPDAFHPSQEGAVLMARRIAGYMGVPEDSFVVEVFTETAHATRRLLPLWEGQSRGAGGLYFHEVEDGKRVIAINAENLKQPDALAATLAHELAHVVLLGGNLLDRETEDMEPMTDLCTVFLGLGVLNANAAVQFRQWSNNQTQGWSTKTAGYLEQEMWGYALALFAKERGEGVAPAWRQALSTDVKDYFTRSAKWLARQK